MALLPALRRHPVATYYTLAFAISWGGVLAVMARSGEMTAAAPADEPLFIYALVAMLAGPTAAGLAATALVHGRGGLRELSARLLRWRAGLRWYAVALLMAPVLWTATIGVFALTSPRFAPALLTSDDTVTLVTVGLAAALAAGLFEELGWTGFAIPELRRRHGVLVTGLVAGVLWGAWHVLTNVVWAAPITAGDLPMPVFLPASLIGALFGYLAAFRVLMVWVYEQTRSVFVAILMHVSLTASVLILDPAGLTGVSTLAYSYSLAAVVWVVVAVIGWRTGWRAPSPGARDADRRRAAGAAASTWAAR